MARSKDGWIILGGFLGLALLGAASASQTSPAEAERRQRLHLLKKRFIRAVTKRQTSEQEMRTFVSGLYQRAAFHLGMVAPPLLFDYGTNNASSDGTSVRVNIAWAWDTLTKFCDTQTCPTSVILGTMAHELGHHLHQDALFAGNSHAKELRADRCAGAVLKKANVSPHDFARVMNELSAHHSETHPLGPDRVEAIREGYRTGKF